MTPTGHETIQPTEAPRRRGPIWRLLAWYVLVVGVALAFCKEAPAQESTPTETPTGMPTATPTPPPFVCSGTVMAADFARATVLSVQDGNTCTLGGGFYRPDLAIELYGGTFNTNDQNFTASAIDYGVATQTVVVNLGASHITSGFGGVIPGGVNVTVNPGTSQLTCRSGHGVAPHNQPLYDVIFDGPGVTLGALGRAHDVTFMPGTTAAFNPGFINEYAWNSMRCDGTADNPIEIEVVEGIDLGIATAAQVTCTHMALTRLGCHTNLPCRALNSVDNGGNTNWCFGDDTACPPVTWTPGPPTQTPSPRVFTVDSTLDGTDAIPGDRICATSEGGCTLRAAIEELNADGGGTIQFNVPGGGAQTIALTSALPTVTGSVTIDGTTQPGSSCGDLWAGRAPVWNVRIDCNNMTNGGLWLGSSGATVKGLEIFNVMGDTSQAYALRVNGHSTVQCNHLHDAWGGIFAAGDGNQVGGCNAGDGNLANAMGFSGLTSYGNGNAFQGNFIGTDASGTSAMPCADRGVYIEAGSNALAGGSGAGCGNLISGNTYSGISIKPNAGVSGTTIQNNYIGVGRDGVTNLCNGYPQISDPGGTDPMETGNVFGDCLPPPPPPGCCQFADGTGIGHPGPTCLDNAYIYANLDADGSISAFGGCAGIADALGTTPLTDNPSSNCTAAGSLDGTCPVEPPSPTPPPTPADAATATPTPPPTNTASTTPTPSDAPTTTATPTPTPTLAAGCPATPVACAYTAGKNSVLVKLNTTRRRFQWNWKRGTTPLAQADFGDPVNGFTSYTLCVYDQSGPTTYALATGLSVTPGGTCATRPCWRPLGTTGWTYKNATGIATGLTKLVLRGGSAGRPSLQLAGRGSSLRLPTPVSGTRFFNESPAVIVQLHSSSPARCWSSTFDAACTKKNDGVQFKATTAY